MKKTAPSHLIKSDSILCILISLFLAISVACSSPNSVVPNSGPAVSRKPTDSFHKTSETSPRENSLDAQKAPYVVLIGLDGFRHDYAELYGAKNLLALAKAGVRAKNMVSVFPSDTFPNFYSIVTGLYPENHGILSNHFFDPKSGDEFRLHSPTVNDGKWYLGEALWTSTLKNNMLSASCFWVGSEAAGKTATYYRTYFHEWPNSKRVDQILEWLALPEAQRPHFITAYFALADSVGHEFGPDSENTRDAVRELDDLIGNLRAKLAALKLPIYLVVVSDHGMVKVEDHQVLTLPDTIDLSNFIMGGQKGSILHFYLRPEVSEAKRKTILNDTYAKIKAAANADKRYRIWKREELGRFHLSKSERIGDLFLEATPPYLVLPHGFKGKRSIGMHGWRPDLSKDLNGIFFAEGPRIKSGVTISKLHNIDVYPFVAEILGLKVLPKVDGTLRPFRRVLKGKTPLPL